MEADDDAVALVRTEPDACPLAAAIAGAVLLAAVLLLSASQKGQAKTNASK